MNTPVLVVLGIAQDAGYPQAGCRGACCRAAWADPALRRSAACVALVDPALATAWLIDATPDFRTQLGALNALTMGGGDPPGITGILLTHGHMGHVTGLVQLGHEAMATRELPVYAMPLLARYLATNGPFAQLVSRRNIDVRPLAPGVPVALGAHLTVTPVTVPHRDEVSETVAFRIAGPRRTVLYLPDIDRWTDGDAAIERWLEDVDLAYIDGTFFDAGEIPGRDPRTIPHPTIRETMARLARLPASVRRRVRFIHLNHTNPCFDPDSAATRAVVGAGFGLAVEGERVEL
jgi:pyrroloquinoline quinone biosynthesis protein B